MREGSYQVDDDLRSNSGRLEVSLGTEKIQLGGCPSGLDAMSHNADPGRSLPRRLSTSNRRRQVLGPSTHFSLPAQKVGRNYRGFWLPIRPHRPYSWPFDPLFRSSPDFTLGHIYIYRSAYVGEFIPRALLAAVQGNITVLEPLRFFCLCYPHPLSF
jgi:hypothetical protein